MMIGSDSNLSSGLMLALSSAEHQRNEEQRPPASAMLDAVDELNRDPERRGVDEQSQKELHLSRIL